MEQSFQKICRYKKAQNCLGINDAKEFVGHKCKHCHVIYKADYYKKHKEELYQKMKEKRKNKKLNNIEKINLDT